MGVCSSKQHAVQRRMAAATQPPARSREAEGVAGPAVLPLPLPPPSSPLSAASEEAAHVCGARSKTDAGTSSTTVAPTFVLPSDWCEDNDTREQASESTKSAGDDCVLVDRPEDEEAAGTSASAALENVSASGDDVPRQFETIGEPVPQSSTAEMQPQPQAAHEAAPPPDSGEAAQNAPVEASAKCDDVSTLSDIDRQRDGGESGHVLPRETHKEAPQRLSLAPDEAPAEAEAVRAHLRSFGVAPGLVDAVLKAGYDIMDDVAVFSDADIVEVERYTEVSIPPGHRRRLLRAAGALTAKELQRRELLPGAMMPSASDSEDTEPSDTSEQDEGCTHASDESAHGGGRHPVTIDIEGIDDGTNARGILHPQHLESKHVELQAPQLSASIEEATPCAPASLSSTVGSECSLPGVSESLPLEIAESGTHISVLSLRDVHADDEMCVFASVDQSTTGETLPASHVSDPPSAGARESPNRARGELLMRTARTRPPAQSECPALIPPQVGGPPPSPVEAIAIPSAPSVTQVSPSPSKLELHQRNTTDHAGGENDLQERDATGSPQGITSNGDTSATISDALRGGQVNRARGELLARTGGRASSPALPSTTFTSAPSPASNASSPRLTASDPRVATAMPQAEAESEEHIVGIIDEAFAALGSPVRTTSPVATSSLRRRIDTSSAGPTSDSDQVSDSDTSSQSGVDASSSKRDNDARAAVGIYESGQETNAGAESVDTGSCAETAPSPRAKGGDERSPTTTSVCASMDCKRETLSLSTADIVWRDMLASAEDRVLRESKDAQQGANETARSVTPKDVSMPEAARAALRKLRQTRRPASAAPRLRASQGVKTAASAGKTAGGLARARSSANAAVAACLTRASPYARSRAVRPASAAARLTQATPWGHAPRSGALLRTPSLKRTAASASQPLARRSAKSWVSPKAPRSAGIARATGALLSQPAPRSQGIITRTEGTASSGLCSSPYTSSEEDACARATPRASVQLAPSRQRCAQQTDKDRLQKDRAPTPLLDPAERARAALVPLAPVTPAQAGGAVSCAGSRPASVSSSASLSRPRTPAEASEISEHALAQVAQLQLLGERLQRRVSRRATAASCRRSTTSAPSAPACASDDASDAVATRRPRGVVVASGSAAAWMGDKLRLQSTLEVEVREAVERRVLALKAQVEAVASA